MIYLQKVPTNDVRPVWFVYSGMGSQWPGMAQELMRLDPFRQSVLKCSECVHALFQYAYMTPTDPMTCSALRHLGCDPYSLIMNSNAEIWKNTMNCMVCITAIQVPSDAMLQSRCE